MRRLSGLLILITLFFGTMTLMACGGDWGGDYGVTPGGVQDIDYARALVEGGTLPPSESLTVEGLLSQHDLPTVGEPCESMVCVRPAVAEAPDLLTGESAIWLQLGMTSALEARERPPLDLTIVIDRSSAMSIDMEETNQAVLNLVDTLSADDRLSILAFSDDVRVIHPHGPVSDTVVPDVEAIRASGGFSPMPAIERAVAMQLEAGDDPSRLRRVVMLSCGTPDVYAFEAVAERAAASRIGFTFVPVLLGYSSPIADVLGRTRGGNMDYGGTLEQTAALFTESADALLSPLAYDLHFELELAGYEVVRAYGIPGAADATGGTLLDVATAFPSSRRGAIVVRLQRTDAADQTIGRATLTYDPESAWAIEGSRSDAPLALPEGDTAIRYGSVGVRKAVALVNMIEVLRDVLATPRAADAGARVDTLLTHLRSEAEALEDEGLRSEVAFVEALRALL